MNKQGTVVRWDEDRGFGFIRSAESRADVFFHVRDFRGQAHRTPQLGQVVTFEEIHVGGKGPRAMAVQAIGSAAPSRANESRTRPTRPTRPAPAPVSRRPASAAGGPVVALLSLAYIGGLWWATWMHALPWWVAVAWVLLNLVTFHAYAMDKEAAQVGRWRVSEDALHAWTLVGGWLGAWAAQQVLRHKSAKASFRRVYWATALLHCAVAAAWLVWRVG